MPGLWIGFTLLAAAGQTARNALQRGLTERLGTVGATQVRFLFGLPFALAWLGGVLGVTGAGLPPLHAVFWAWVTLGAAAQIGATALMLAAMRAKSFVLTTAYTKTEPVQVALFGLVVLGDPVTWGRAGAIALATLGVMLISLPGRGSVGSARAVAQGLLAGSLFAVSAIGFRAAIRSLEGGFVVAAATTLVCALALQAGALGLWLGLTDRAVLRATLAAWRPSLGAGFAGAFASAFWFLAFAIETAARVRTLALVEILFAQIVSGRLLRERIGAREALGLALVALGCGLIINL